MNGSCKNNQNGGLKVCTALGAARPRVSHDACCDAQNRLTGDVHPQDAGQNYPL
jgi:hypothetical protein